MNDPFDLSDSPPPHPGPGSGLEAGLAPPSPYLERLNESQREAVEAIDGPVLVLAGAGTGKTRVLTTRLGHILLQGRARPWEMLAVTFTNKAAKEMQERVADLLGHPVEGWWVGTFHALGARMLRSNPEAAGLKSNFTILDADDQLRLVKQQMEPFGLDEKRWPARAVLGQIQRWKDRGLMPDKVTLAEGADAADGRLLDLYKAYQERLRAVNAADFGDLLLLCLKVFHEMPDVLAKYQRQFRYILVDEYQDTNVAQYLWLRALAQSHRNICCVGDDDQSIYSWRGAEVGNILRFEEDFPGAAVVRLERNYRSTPHILGAASSLISNNQGRLGKTLWTDTNEGEKVRVRGLWDGEAEARFVGDEIEALQTKGARLSDMAVLVRAGFQTREFEERLITLGLPYRVIGGPRFYERQEIRDAIAYLRVIAQSDDDLAFERIVNVPKRGLGKAAMQTLHLAARAERISLVAATWKLLQTEELRPAARKTLRSLLEDFERWRHQATEVPPGELAGIVLDEAGYTEMWQLDKSPEAPGRLDNLKELVSAIGDFETLGGFLEHVSLVMENEDKTNVDKVSLMTLHGAKGLEFDTVFLPGWEEGLFPHQRVLDETGTTGLEEERRLAYVGITRAKKRAFISYASSRQVYGRWQSNLPSRFVEELPSQHIEHDSDTGASPRGRALDDGGYSGFQVDTDWKPRRFRKVDPLLVEASAKPVSGSAPEGGLEEGQRIFHLKFGYGRILARDGDKLEIEFEKAGTKKVMESFVEAV
ncbi:MAG: ATP-dependent helicase [Magnetovibrionaceae bacterium]